MAGTSKALLIPVSVLTVLLCNATLDMSVQLHSLVCISALLSFVLRPSQTNSQSNSDCWSGRTIHTTYNFEHKLFVYYETPEKDIFHTIPTFVFFYPGNVSGPLTYLQRQAQKSSPLLIIQFSLKTEETHLIFCSLKTNTDTCQLGVNTLKHTLTVTCVFVTLEAKSFLALLYSSTALCS